MRIVALDPSLTATGVADSARPAPWTISYPRLQGEARLHAIHKHVIAVTQGADLVVIEGYAYAEGARAHSMGELGGLIRVGLWARNIPKVEIPPANMKKVATGNGGAKKEAVLAEAIRRLGYKGSNNNETDALWLLQCGLIHYGLAGAPELPKKHLEGLEKVQWPSIEELEKRRTA